MCKYTVVGENILVSVIPQPSETLGGIVLPEASQQRVVHAVVVGVSDEIKKIVVGDKVVYGAQSHTTPVDEYFVVSEYDVLLKYQ